MELFNIILNYLGPTLTVMVIIGALIIYIKEYFKVRDNVKQNKLIDLEMKVIDSYHQSLLDIQQLQSKLNTCVADVRELRKEIDSLTATIKTTVAELQKWELQGSVTTREISELREKISNILHKK